MRALGFRVSLPTCPEAQSAGWPQYTTGGAPPVPVVAPVPVVDPAPVPVLAPPVLLLVPPVAPVPEVEVEPVPPAPPLPVGWQVAVSVSGLTTQTKPVLQLFSVQSPGSHWLLEPQV